MLKLLQALTTILIPQTLSFPFKRETTQNTNPSFYPQDIFKLITGLHTNFHITRDALDFDQSSLRSPGLSVNIDVFHDDLSEILEHNLSDFHLSCYVILPDLAAAVQSRPAEISPPLKRDRLPCKLRCFQ